MDIATIVGIVVAFGLIVWSILLGGSLSGFIDIPSVAVVLGGTLGALLINFPLANFLGMGKIIMKTIMFSLDEPGEVIGKMVKYAERARREGMLALEEDSENETDPFLRKGLRLAVDGTDPQLLEKILETDVEQIENRHADGAKLLGMGGTFAPAYGIQGRDDDQEHDHRRHHGHPERGQPPHRGRETQVVPVAHRAGEG